MYVLHVWNIWRVISVTIQHLMESWVINPQILDVVLLSLICLGKITKNIFRGEEHITDAKSNLKSSIDLYNNALGNINLRIVIKVYELLKGTYLMCFAVT
jgi:hypothetical protein